MSKVEQTTSLSIDEEGVEGASYTEMVVYCGCVPEEEHLENVEFVVDRPFLFVVRKSGVPLFVGKMVKPVKG